ncbi:MAG: hypothetical protein IIA49_08075, partial [Bacteroidetes bacterium]|nr:hypothetical protein [Bacteroidota bacterium]
MIIKKATSFLLLVIVISLVSNAYGQSIDELSKAVVFLQKERQAFEKKSGKNFEVWYKDTTTNKLEPKTIKHSGTGFLIKHNGRDYIVTAEHVAKFLDNNSEILLNVSKDSSIKISFDLIRKSPSIKNAKWFMHPMADIALHPILYPTAKVEQMSINTSDIIKDDEKMNLLTDVIVLGFPLGLGVHKSLSPIANKSQLASNITTIDLP